jgi:hypothetical protein
LSGFGCFIEQQVPDHDSYGINIVDRRYKGGDESIQQLADCLFNHCILNRRQRVIMRNRTGNAGFSIHKIQLFRTLVRNSGLESARLPVSRSSSNGLEKAPSRLGDQNTRDSEADAQTVERAHYSSKKSCFELK